MKIGLDLRTINTNTVYFKFIYEFLSNIKSNDTETKYIVYTSPLNYYNFVELSNTLEIKKLAIKAGNIEDQFAGSKFFSEEKLDNLVFFSYKRPYFYKKRNLIILESIKDLLYPKHKSSIQKYIDLFLMKLSFKNTNEILGFSKDIISGLNEKLNIKENKINIVNGFFINSRKNTDFIDIRMKYNIVNDYIIYPGTLGQNKNIPRLIEAIARINNEESINIDLLFLDKDIASSIEIRELVLKNNLQNKVKFLSEIKDEDMYFYYKESLGVVFPSLYESFPFELSDAINFETKIIASKIENIKHIFGENIEYFAPMSVREITDIIKNIKKEKKNNYDDIKSTYNIDNFLAKFIEKIK